MDELDAPLIGLDPSFFDDPIDQLVLAVSDPAYCLGIGRIVRASFGKLNASRCQKIANAVETRLPVHMEAIVLREIERGLPATIHRPSMVVGDSRDGVVRRFQVFYHLLRFIAGSRTRGWLPAFGDARLDLVPADYVARALVACSRRDDAVGRILHLCAGPTGAIRLADLGERLRVFLASRGETVFRPRYLPLPAMRALLAVATPLSPGSVRRALATLPFFLDYLRDPQLFEHERTSRFLEGGGIVAPPIVRFLEPVLDYWYTRSSRHADAAEA